MNEHGSINAQELGGVGALVPVKVLILALGGEGGAVMADWLVEALLAAGFPVQATSVPGVAQRTGATSYYIEFLPARRNDLKAHHSDQDNARSNNERHASAVLEPVFCLSPAAGQVDVLISSELLETGRAIERGLVTPRQTTLISSTSRFLTVMEKMQMADGRFDNEPIIQAAQQMSRNCALFDMAQVTRDAGTVISSVMFGALAASGRLPLSRVQCEAAIGSAGASAQASLRGFAQGFDICAGLLATTGAATLSASPKPAATAQRSTQQVLGINLPSQVAEIAALGVARLTDYQDEAYARSYLKHIQEFVAAETSGSDYAASRTAARFLALWMAYEDVIRVADLKSRKSRFARIREEYGATANEPVVVRDFLKPGVEEVAAVLPKSIAQRLSTWAQRRGKKTFSDGMQLQTSSIIGLGLMRALAAMRSLRRSSSRFADEQALIERWSRALLAALALEPRLARELAECPRLIKGYSDTFARGKKNFVEIMQTLVEPALFGEQRQANAPATVADSIKRAREAALEDPAGRALAASLGLPMPRVKEQPIRFVPMKRPRR